MTAHNLQALNQKGASVKHKGGKKKGKMKGDMHSKGGLGKGK